VIRDYFDRLFGMGRLGDMANSKKKAEAVLERYDETIALHLCKIFVHKKSSTDKYWRGELEGYFRRVIQTVCNLVGSRGCLKPDDFKDFFENIFTGIWVWVGDVYKDKDYVKMVKSFKGLSVEAVEDIIDDELKPALQAVVGDLRNMLAVHNKGNDTAFVRQLSSRIVGIIFDITVDTRDRLSS
jgi:hypothetical protein